MQMQIKYQIFSLKNKVICINRPSQNLSLCNLLILQVEDAFLCIISCRLHKVEYVVRFISDIIKKRHSLYRKQSFSAMGVHYNGAIMSAMAYEITRLTVVYWTVIHAQMKESIKAPRHLPLWGEFPAQ